MTQHTRTPWRTDPDYCNDIQTSDGKLTIASIWHEEGGPWLPPLEEAEANAAFIVRACNAHDDMLSALRDVAEYLGDEPVAPSYPSAHHAATVALIRSVRAAIARAEGRS